MTKTIKRLLPAALAVLLAGCAMQPVDSTTARYRVALIAKNNRNSEFWDAVFIGAEAAATEYNLQLTITAPDDEEDYAAQNQLIADAVEDGAQAIVFSAIDYEANAAAIDAAAAAGVTVISVDSAVNSDNVAAYIGADNYGAGRMVAQSALDGMEGALCVGLINYEVNGANGRDREQGARDAFAESGRARITAAVSTHPNAASARADTLAMLRTHPEINVLIALSETTAVGALHLRGASPFRLSGGQKKRVAIATVLSMEPSVLVMDEPTSNLDPRARRQIIDLIRRFGHTTLIATHDMEMVLDLCDRTIVMKQGRIVADGSTRHVFGDLALLEECGLEQPCELRMKRALKREYAL